MAASVLGSFSGAGHKKVNPSALPDVLSAPHCPCEEAVRRTPGRRGNPYLKRCKFLSTPIKRSVQGKRIAEPVCALARNDSVFGTLAKMVSCFIKPIIIF